MYGLKAEGELVAAFDTNAFRVDLAAQGFGGVKLAAKSSTELLDDLKDKARALYTLLDNSMSLLSNLR